MHLDRNQCMKGSYLNRLAACDQSFDSVSASHTRCNRCRPRLRWCRCSRRPPLGRHRRPCLVAIVEPPSRAAVLACCIGCKREKQYGEKETISQIDCRRTRCTCPASRRCWRRLWLLRSVETVGLVFKCARITYPSSYYHGTIIQTGSYPCNEVCSSLLFI
jgi:hypothetical protein